MRSWVLAVCFTGSDKYLQWKAREYFFFRATDFFYDKMHSMKSRFFFIDGDSIRAYRSGGVTCRDRAAQGGRIASAGGAVHSAGQFSQAVVINKSPYALQTVDFLTSVVYPPVEVVKTVRCLRVE